MNCPKCGSQVEDDSKYCAVCGSLVEESEISTESVSEKDSDASSDPVAAESSDKSAKDPANEKPKASSDASGENKQAANPIPSSEKKRSSFDFSYLKDPARIIGLIIGTIFVLVGLMKVSDASVSYESATFGADFYTYTYRGIGVVARELGEVQKSLGWLIAAVGAAIDVRAFLK